MEDKSYIYDLIKKTVQETEPDATVILYGSRARGDYREDSDFDFLILLNKETMTREEKNEISGRIFMVSIDTNTSIHPKIYTKNGWTTHRVTPFYENVNREGQVI